MSEFNDFVEFVFGTWFETDKGDNNLKSALQRCYDAGYEAGRAAEFDDRPTLNRMPTMVDTEDLIPVAAPAPYTSDR
jgi:hypothetical protein